MPILTAVKKIRKAQLKKAVDQFLEHKTTSEKCPACQGALVCEQIQGVLAIYCSRCSLSLSRDFSEDAPSQYLHLP